MFNLQESSGVGVLKVVVRRRGGTVEQYSTSMYFKCAISISSRPWNLIDVQKWSKIPLYMYPSLLVNKTLRYAMLKHLKTCYTENLSAVLVQRGFLNIPPPCSRRTNSTGSVILQLNRLRKRKKRFDLCYMQNNSTVSFILDIYFSSLTMICAWSGSFDDQKYNAIFMGENRFQASWCQNLDGFLGISGHPTTKYWNRKWGHKNTKTHRP